MRHFMIACMTAALLWSAQGQAAESKADVKAQQIAKTIHTSGELVNYRVGVKYKDGTAWLLGNVTSQEQAAAAVRLAEGVKGIKKVVNKLEIKPAEAKVAQSKPKTDDGLALANLEAASVEVAPKPLPTPTAMAEPIAKPVAQPRVAARPMPASPMPVAHARPGALPRPMQMMPPRPQGVRAAGYAGGGYAPQGHAPQGYSTAGGGAAGVSYDQANMPGYAWPSYAAHPNYAALTYPKQYSPSAWPYIGPFYPYPQVPLGWRKVTLEWDDGWWNLDFSHKKGH